MFRGYDVTMWIQIPQSQNIIQNVQCVAECFCVLLGCSVYITKAFPYHRCYSLYIMKLLQPIHDGGHSAVLPLVLVCPEWVLDDDHRMRVRHTPLVPPLIPVKSRTTARAVPELGRRLIIPPFSFRQNASTRCVSHKEKFLVVSTRARFFSLVGFFEYRKSLTEIPRNACVMDRASAVTWHNPIPADGRLAELACTGAS